MKHALMFAFILVCAAPSTAQTDQIDAAAQALENRDYPSTISLVAGAEQQLGASPRLESIRAMAWHESGNAVEAFKSLERYAELTRGIAGLDANSNHRELMQLLEEYRARLAKERTEIEEEIKKERDAEAARIEAAAREAVQRKREALQQRFKRKFATLPPQRWATVSRDDVAELKSAGVNTAAATYDERVFGIAKLDSGRFRLGMTRDEIEAAIYPRLRDVSSEMDRILHDLLDRYRLPQTARVHFGEVFNVLDGNTEYLLSGGTDLEDFAWGESAFRLHRHQEMLLDRLRAATYAEGSAVASLVPGNTKAWLAQVAYEEERVVELTFVLVLPSTTVPDTVVTALTQHFGRVQPLTGAEPDGVRRFQPARDHLRGGDFAFPAVEGLQLSGRVVQCVEYDLRVPVFLGLKLRRLSERDDPLNPPPVSVGGLYPGASFAHARRHAIIAVNRAQQLANDEVWDVGGVRRKLEIGAEGFRLNGASAQQRFTVVDAARGVREEAVFENFLLHTARDFGVDKKTDSNAPGVVSVRFDRSVPRRGEGVATFPPEVVPFFFKGSRGSDLTHPLRRAALLSLEAAADELTPQAIGAQIALLDNGIERNEFIRALIERVEERGKPIDPVITAKYFAGGDPAKYVSLLRRAAEAGSADNMRLLVAYEKRLGGKSMITQEEAQRWAKAGAELGDVDCTKRFIELIEDWDYVTTNYWTKQLQARGVPIDPESAGQREKRAQQLAQMRALKPEQRIRAYLPPDITNVIGQKFEGFAKGRAFTMERDTSPVTGRDIAYQCLVHTEDVKVGEPVSVWVNRRGVVIGAYYYMGRRLNKQFGYLRQVFEPEQLTYPPNTPPNTAPDVKEAAGVVANKFKTIGMFRYEKGDCYLAVIDHTKE